MKRKITFLILLTIIFSIPASSHAIDIGSVISQAATGVAAVAEASKDFTPAEEHYLGRAVAAMAIAKYPLLNNPALTKYVNDVGLLVAYASDRPSTYGGYHFAVLNSNEPNAFACPGGFIFINKGLLKLLKNEDELASVLAHEVAHVAHRHAIKDMKKAKLTGLAFYTAGQISKQYTPAEIGELVGVFQDMVTDVAKKALESGYSKGDEKDADEYGMKFANQAGYNPGDMVNFFNTLESMGVGTSSGPFSSHPKTNVRIKALEKDLADMGKVETEKVRTARFKAAVAAIR